MRFGIQVFTRVRTGLSGLRDNLPMQSPAPSDTLLTFPCAFPIKVMGHNHPMLRSAVTDIACAHDASFDASTITQRASSGAAYIGLTLTIHATSREQLDAIYRALCAHPLVKVVL